MSEKLKAFLIDMEALFLYVLSLQNACLMLLQQRELCYKKIVLAFRNTVKNRSGPAAVIGDMGCK